MENKNKTIYFVFLFFILLIVIMPFSFAFWKEIGDYFIGPEFTIRDLIIFLTIFIMFGLAFSDIIRMFTLFSPVTSAFIGFGIALILALTKVMARIVQGLVNLTAALGAFSVFVAVATAFFIFIGVHLAIGSLTNWFNRWVLKRKILMQATKQAVKPAEAWEALKTFEEYIK